MTENQHTCVARLDGGPIMSPANCPVCLAAVKARFDRQARALELLEACEVLDHEKQLRAFRQLFMSGPSWSVGVTAGDPLAIEPDLPSALIAAARSLKGGS